MIDDFYLNPHGELCARCGKVARGSAYVGDLRFCHPDDPAAPDCYHIVTVYQPPAVRHAI